MLICIPGRKSGLILQGHTLWPETNLAKPDSGSVLR